MFERLPAITPHRNLVDPGSPSSEPFRALRLSLDLRAESNTARVVLFTSALPGEGKSTLAANYALVASLSYSKVLLIDADLRRPQVHQYFGLARGPGLVEALATGVGSTVHARSMGNLSVLTAGHPAPRSGDIAASRGMARMLAHASESHGLVILDSPPLLSAPDAAGLATHPGVEVVLVVNRTTRRRSIRSALQQLRLIEARIAGVVVNREGQLAAYGYAD